MVRKLLAKAQAGWNRVAEHASLQRHAAGFFHFAGQSESKQRYPRSDEGVFMQNRRKKAYLHGVLEHSQIGH